MFSHDLLPQKNGEENTKHFLREVVEMLLNYVCASFDRKNKVLDFHHPHQLKEGIEGFGLDLSDKPENLDQLLVDCRDTLKYGVKTGGTISNLYSVLIARYKRFPEVKTKGMASLPTLVLFTSEHSHYSIKKVAAILGFGTENVILVKCNERISLDIRRNIVSYVLNDWDRFTVWTDDGSGDNYTTQEHYKSEMLKPFTYGSASVDQSTQEAARKTDHVIRMTEPRPPTIRAKAFAQNVFINQERQSEVRRRSDTVVVPTINDADWRSGGIIPMTRRVANRETKVCGFRG
ncbi:DCE1 decarboxylase, partial [Polypterus senegalus]